MTKGKMHLPDSVKIAMDTLCKNGHEAYVVGGCVRDFVMGKAPHDFDMTTNATPDQMLEIFADYTTITAGVKHGTVAVMIDGEKIEITTYRIDGDYNDSRHPESVVFSTSLRDDTLRRDFTVNAMAYSEKDGIVDFVGGLADVERKTIRAVGEAKKRFQEDALRILRALRFSSVLGFEIDGATSLASKECASLLTKISSERVCEELDKLLAGHKVGDLMEEYEAVFSVVLPEIYPITKEKLTALSYGYENVFVSYAILFDGLSREDASMICSHLRFSNERKSRVLAILSFNDIPQSKTELKILLSKIGLDSTLDFLKYKKAFGYDVKKAEEHLLEIEKNNECYSLKMLAVDGRCLMSVGIKTGKEIGKILDELLSLVIRGELKNERSALLEYVKSKKDEWIFIS